MAFLQFVLMFQRTGIYIIRYSKQHKISCCLRGILGGGGGVAVLLNSCFEIISLDLLTSPLPLLPPGNLLVPVHAVCISHGGGLGRLQNCGEISGD